MLFRSSRCSLLAFSFSSFSRPWYNTWEAEGAEHKEQGGTGVAPRPRPCHPARPHFDVLLLPPMVLDEAAGGDAELLTVALYLQDGALDAAQQLFILQQKDKGSLPGAPPGVPPLLVSQPLKHHPANRPTSDPILDLLSCRHNSPPPHGLALRDLVRRGGWSAEVVSRPRRGELLP